MIIQTWCQTDRQMPVKRTIPVSTGDVVFVKGSDSKHSSLDLHILRSTNSGKSVLRKALHCNHNDASPTIISPKFKTVENKFLLKPNPFNSPEDHHSHPSPHCRPQVSFPVQPSLKPKLREEPTKPWIPLSQNEEINLVPVLMPDFQLNDQPCLTPRRLTPPPISTYQQLPVDQLTLSPSLSLELDVSHYADDEQSVPSHSNQSDALFDEGHSPEDDERLD